MINDKKVYGGCVIMRGNGKAVGWPL